MVALESREQSDGFSGFLRERINEFRDSHGLQNMEDVAEAIGVAASTLYYHMSRKRDFKSGTWTKICNSLGIRKEDLERFNGERIIGMDEIERNKLRDEIGEAIEIIRGYGEDITNDQIIGLISRNGFGRTGLESVIGEVRRERGIPPSRSELYREILSLNSEIKKIVDPENEEFLRTTRTGNLFEEIALLSLQMHEKYSVAQYCLTPIRDENGNVVFTKDIMDFIVLKKNKEPTLKKALAELSIKEGDFEKLGEGEIVERIKKVGNGAVMRSHYVANGKVIHTEIRSLMDGEGEMPERSIIKRRWSQYKDNQTGETFFIEDMYFDEDNPLCFDRSGLLFDKDKKSDESKSWERVLPYRAIEVKTAGSRNIDDIIKQTNRQKSALLRHRERNPSSIPALVSGIDILVLKDNYKLEQAVKNDPLIDYVPKTEINKLFLPLLEELQNGRYTADEINKLREFFSRLNLYLSENPTLKPLEEMREDFVEEIRMRLAGDKSLSDDSVRRAEKRGITLGSKIDYSQEPKNTEKIGEEMVEDVKRRFRETGEINLLDAMTIQLSRRNDEERNDKLKILEEMMPEFYREIAIRVDEEKLDDLLKRYIPNSSSDGRRLNSSMIVHEEVDGQLVSYGRRFGGKGITREIAERVREIIESKKYQELGIDLEDEDSLQTFIELLREKRDAKTKRRELHENQEEAFKINLLNCRFSSYSDESELRYCHRFESLTRLESGLMSALESKIFGKQLNERQMMDEKMMINAFVQQFLYSGREENAFVSNLRKVLTRSKDGRTIYQKGEEFSEEIYKVFGEINDRKQVFTADDLIKWRARFSELSVKYEEVLSHNISPGNEGERAMLRGRRSVKVNIPDRAYEQLEKIVNQDPEIMELFNVAGEAGRGQLVGDLINQEIAPELIEKMREIADRNPAKVEEMRARFIDGVGTALKNKSADIYGGVITEYSSLEQKILFEFGKRAIDNAIVLSCVSQHLARDYLETNLEAVVTFPEVYSDVYLKRIRESIVLMNDESIFNSVNVYLNEKAQNNGNDIDKTRGEFLRRLSLMAMESKTDRQEYLQAISSGDFETAKNIEGRHDEPTIKPIARAYKKILRDPHLMFMLRSESISRYRSGRDDERTVELMKKLGLGDLRLFGKSFDELQKAYEQFSETIGGTIPDDKVLHGHIRNLLYAFKELPGGLQTNMANMFRIEKYKGFRQYDKARKAILYLLNGVSEQNGRFIPRRIGNLDVPNSQLIGLNIAMQYFVKPREFLTRSGYISEEEVQTILN